MISPYHTLITGASRGLGRALALECARRRMNLILVSLPGEWLHDLAASIRVTYRVDVIAIEMDLCEERAGERLFRIVANRERKVNMLINNLGMDHPGIYTPDGKAFEKQLRRKELATVEITHRFLPMLRENGPSYILNRKPYFPIRKKQNPHSHFSFMEAMTDRLRQELHEGDIHVSLLCPGRLYSSDYPSRNREMNRMLSRLCAMEPEKLAPLAIDGLLRRKKRIHPGYRHRMMGFLDRVPLSK
jgi:uncharacterized protein